MWMSCPVLVQVPTPAVMDQAPGPRPSLLVYMPQRAWGAYSYIYCLKTAANILIKPEDDSVGIREEALGRCRILGKTSQISLF